MEGSGHPLQFTADADQIHWLYLVSSVHLGTAFWDSGWSPLLLARGRLWTWSVTQDAAVGFKTTTTSFLLLSLLTFLVKVFNLMGSPKHHPWADVHKLFSVHGCCTCQFTIKRVRGVPRKAPCPPCVIAALRPSDNQAQLPLLVRGLLFWHKEFKVIRQQLRLKV